VRLKRTRAARTIDVMTIRPLTPEDGPALAEFYASLSERSKFFFEPFGPEASAWLPDHLAEGASGAHYVVGLVSDGGEIEGHAFILAVRSEHPTLGIGLRDRVHGQGWGRRMMQHVLAWADAAGLPAVELTVVRANTRAQALYRSFGFVQTGDATFRSPNDSLAMRRERPPLLGAAVR
jgi:ribosomal protein S18 acetylase RimI-like enzyme